MLVSLLPSSIPVSRHSLANCLLSMPTPACNDTQAPTMQASERCCQVWAQQHHQDFQAAAVPTTLCSRIAPCSPAMHRCQSLQRPGRHASGCLCSPYPVCPACLSQMCRRCRQHSHVLQTFGHPRQSGSWPCPQLLCLHTAAEGWRAVGWHRCRWRLSDVHLPLWKWASHRAA